MVQHRRLLSECSVMVLKNMVLNFINCMYSSTEPPHIFVGVHFQVLSKHTMRTKSAAHYLRNLELEIRCLISQSKPLFTELNEIERYPLSILQSMFNFCDFICFLKSGTRWQLSATYLTQTKISLDRPG